MRTIPARLLHGTAGARRRYLAAALLVVIVLSGCSHKGPGKDWQTLVSTVRARFAPDARLAVFRVDLRADGDRIIANGEVESKAAKGIDCSGFVKTVPTLNGMPLDRDADRQAQQGEDVLAEAAFQNLRCGDLLFFGEKAVVDKPERIVHVGIYLKDRKFIHCSGRARVSSLDPAAAEYDERHAKGFVRARRFVAP